MDNGKKLTVSRKKAKKLTISREKAKKLTANRKSHYPIETLLPVLWKNIKPPKLNIERYSRF